MTISLQDLIDAAQSAPEGQTPAQAVAALLADAPADADVPGLLDEAVTRFNELHDGGVANDDELAAVEALADVAEGVRTEVERRDQLASERADRIAALAQRVNPADADTPADTDPEAPAEPVAEQPAETGAPEDTPAPAAEPTPAPETAAAPEPVAASAARPRRRVRLADLPRPEIKAPADDAPAGIVITAAAEVEGWAAGARMSTLDDVARAGTAKFEAFPSGHIADTFIRAGIARFQIPFPKDLVATGSDDDDAIERAVDVSKLPGGSLVAAGGWCAPSETLYDLSPILADANAGLISLPEVQAPRGGLRWTEGPDFTTIWNNTGFIQTEAQAIAGTGFTTPIGGTIAGTQKPRYRVPCPNFTEARAEAIGLAIMGGILQNDAYPEVTQDVVAHSLIAHSHRINARTINRMVGEAGAAVTINLGPSATPSLLNSIDAQITDIRYLNRLPESSTLEVVLPIWAKAVIRADQAVRTNSSVAEAYSVTDERINAWFAQRGAVAHWVYDWQDAFTGITGGFGSATAITSWPDTVQVLMYIAGTYVRARGDVISLDALYDTTDLLVNDYQQLFTEEKLLVIKRRYKPRLLTIALSASGATAAAAALDADGKVIPTP